MWFRRKPKNRRLGREQVLDVKLRSSQVRAARTRLGAICLGVLFATVFGLYLVYRTGDWALNRCVYENKAFTIQELDVQTDGVIAVDQLRRWAGVASDENLLALDLARVKRDLEMDSRIKSVSVERILPRTLRIRVTEREPVAQVNVPLPRRSGGIELAVYYLDTEGYVMLPLDPRQRATRTNQGTNSFPVIAGINASELQPGRRILTPSVQAALQLIMAFDQSSMSTVVDLKRVDAFSPSVLVATTGQGSEVVFGLVDLDQQLLRWYEVFNFGQKQSKAIANLDLAVTKNLPIRWIEASAVPPSAPKLPKTLRPKKQHV
jgi:hypothetical protein